MQDRSAFYAAVKDSLFKGSLPDWQREPLDRLIDEGLARDRLLEETAYVLATAYHESGRFKYDEEIGKGEGHRYGEPIWLTSKTRVTYHGRGWVQITWPSNYARMGQILGVDLINAPEKAKEPAVAAQIIWEGMIRGSFTGKALADYIRPGSIDYVGARKIVNGLDRADLIAEHARTFESALRSIEDVPGEFCNECGRPL